jgi:hypothetical protein
MLPAVRIFFHMTRKYLTDISDDLAAAASKKSIILFRIRAAFEKKLETSSFSHPDLDQTNSVKMYPKFSRYSTFEC